MGEEGRIAALMGGVEHHAGGGGLFQLGLDGGGRRNAPRSNPASIFRKLGQRFERGACRTKMRNQLPERYDADVRRSD